MKNFYLPVLIILFILSGCKQDEIVNPGDLETDGQIVLKIDRQNAPENVVTVTAILSRAAYATIIRSMNILTDTTADLSINDLAVGLWHLRVDAADSAGVVQYTGETNVNVLPNQIVQVTLTLIPVGNGMGSIYLYVTWGTAGNNWLDYPGNPILTPIYNGFEGSGIYQGKVLYDDNKYKMWFTGLNPGGNGVIEYAESNDGVYWTRPVNHPVLMPGNYNSWDGECVTLPVILKEADHYKMYYHGWGSGYYGPWFIGLATSTDGINWTKNPNPILSGTSGWESQVAPTDIVKKDGIYYLYYIGAIYQPSTKQFKIGVATSTDGVNFVKSQQNPILTATQGWEGSYIFAASVLLEDGMFKMVYGNSIGTGFGEATSSDGINWTKATTNPFFRPQNTSNNWTNWLAYPCYRKFGSEYRIYYGGIAANSYLYAIGLMKK